MADLIGQHLGQYEIRAILGEGGMATVYRARQESMKRDVAVKVIESKLARNPDFVTRFEREAQTVAALSHIHILKVFDYGDQGDLVYLVMELLNGGSLADLLRQRSLPPKMVGRMLVQIASALDYAHKQGIIHRDLKPQNVLLDDAGNTHLTDFGIAKLLSETSALTMSGVAMGTPAYMAPEQWQGHSILDARADIYSLGIMLFEMLTGQVPFQADTPVSMMHAHVYEAPPPVRRLRADLPPGVDAVIQKALAKNRDQRFASAEELVTAFRLALANQRPVVDTPPRSKLSPATMIEAPVLAQTPIGSTGQLRTSAPRRQRFPVLGIGGVGIVLIISLLALFVTRNNQFAVTPTALVVAAQPTIPASVTDTDVPSFTSTPNLQERAAATFTAKAVLTIQAAESFTPIRSNTPNDQDTLDAIVAATETAVIPTVTPAPTDTPQPTNTLAPPTATLTPGTDRNGCQTYALKAGDSAGSVAESFGVSLADLMQANNFTNVSLTRLQIGQIITIPVNGCGLVTPAPTVTPTRFVIPPVQSSMTLAPTAANAEVQIVQVISPGDITSEGVELRDISSGVIQMKGWTLTDGQGHTFTFPDYRMFPGGRVTIYTRNGTNTPIVLYWQQQNAIWNVPGRQVTLTDAQGVIQATYSVSGNVAPTSRSVPPTRTPVGFPFALGPNSPSLTANLDTSTGCSFQGLGGQVFGSNNEALTGLQINVTSAAGFNQTATTGSNPGYGQSGWQVQVDTKPNATTYIVELRSADGIPLSDKVNVPFPMACQSNLALLNFVQVRPY